MKLRMYLSFLNLWIFLNETNKSGWKLYLLLNLRIIKIKSERLSASFIKLYFILNEEKYYHLYIYWCLFISLEKYFI